VVEQDNELLLKKPSMLPHSLKQMKPHLKNMGEIMIVGVDMYVVGTTNIERIVLIILQKGITHLTIKRIKMIRVCKINHQRAMKVSVIGVVWKGIGHVLVVCLNIW